MTPGPAAGGQQDRRPRRPRHELRRRPLRRHVLRRDVRGRVLRDRPAQSRRDRAAPRSRPDSGYGQIIADVLKWSAENPNDWQKTWRLITEKWDRDDPCPDGALDDFNIDARLNGAFVALGLLYGERDFAKTLEVSARAGQDSDCNPSSAAGILGVMLGYDRDPRPVEERHPEARRHEVRLHAVFVQRDHGVHGRAGAQSDSARGRHRVGIRKSSFRRRSRRRRSSNSGPWTRRRERLEATSGAWTWGTGWKESEGEAT